MQTYTLNLAVNDGDERVQTGYEQSVKADSEQEARDLYLEWLLQCGEDEDVASRILCDAE